ncbi:MAG: RNA polymerase sigma-70 factor [Spirosomaceae bacterium]|jgi:RNA polymerase sigma-70 factor (ECF subfamily)|nr:RNA polymerase sigma-70 factor [Spirosomataceae bacterium]
MPREGSLLYQQVQEHNDYKAFEKLFKQYYKPVCAYAYKILNEVEVAEEVASDVFLKLWRQRDRLEIQTSFDSYLFRAVRNLCLDYRKANKNTNQWVEMTEINQYDAEPSDPSPEQELQYWELHERVEAVIEQLPPQCKLIFRMSRDEGMKYREIAETLNISVKTVETQMGRALKHLRENLLTQPQTAQYHDFTNVSLAWAALWFKIAVGSLF